MGLGWRGGIHSSEDSLILSFVLLLWLSRCVVMGERLYSNGIVCLSWLLLGKLVGEGRGVGVVHRTLVVWCRLLP